MEPTQGLTPTSPISSASISSSPENALKASPATSPPPEIVIKATAVASRVLARPPSLSIASASSTARPAAAPAKRRPIFVASLADLTPPSSPSSGLASRSGAGDTVKKFEILKPPKRDEEWVAHALELCKIEGGIDTTALAAGSNGSYFAGEIKMVTKTDAEGRTATGPSKVNEAILKPCDEELGCLNTQISIRYAEKAKEGIKPGTSAIREVAAHYLFPGIVPPTCLVEVTSPAFYFKSGVVVPKKCSMQKMIPNASDFHKIESPSELKEELKPIALIDIVLHNADRNRGNLLITGEGKERRAHPIDHGCILPDNCQSGGVFTWYEHLDPSDMFSPPQQEEILGINLGESESQLRELELGDGSLNTHNVSTITAKALCRTTPIREIAMYQIDNLTPDGPGFTSCCLNKSILLMAAYKQNPTLVSSGKVTGTVDKGKLEEVVNEVTSFISGQSQFIDEILSSCTDLTPAEKLAIKEGDGPSNQRINLAHQVTRENLSLETFELGHHEEPFNPDYSKIHTEIETILMARIAAAREKRT